MKTFILVFITIKLQTLNKLQDWSYVHNKLKNEETLALTVALVQVVDHLLLASICSFLQLFT